MRSWGVLLRSGLCGALAGFGALSGAAPAAGLQDVPSIGSETNRASERPSRVHSFYGYWGWHVSRYTGSDIRFSGVGYDFTLDDVVAADRPTPFSLAAYLDPSRVTIPQFNARIGFYLTDRFAISLGTDHMKYVVDVDRTVSISGNIDASASPDFAGAYDGDPIQLTEDFLLLEHTDGLNLVSLDGEFTETFWTSGGGSFFLSLLYGAGGGVVVPKSHVTLFGNQTTNPFHLAGWGTTTKAGLRVDLWGKIFLQDELKGGYVSLTDGLVDGPSSPARLEQTFGYLENAIVLGVPFGV
jgi:hypothetical protein